MNATLANVSLPLPFDRLFTYSIPPEFVDGAVPGARVLVPFGKKHKIGYIVELPAATSLPSIKPLEDILDSRPVLTAEMLRLCRWIASYYMAPLGEVLRSATPGGLIGESKRIVNLAESPPPALLEEWQKRAPRKSAIIHTLQTQRDLSIAQLQKHTRFNNIYSPLTELERDGFITMRDVLPRTAIKPKTETMIRLNRVSHTPDDFRDAVEQLGSRAKKQAAILQALLDRGIDTAVGEKELLQATGASKNTLRSLAGRGLLSAITIEVSREEIEDVAEPDPVQLTHHQRAALQCITDAINGGSHRTILLHGITGSGKTQVYIEAIHHTRASGKTAIVLVPEISLTPQIVERFRGHFKGDVVVFHSRLSEGERYDGWKRARDGNASIAIGPRSAIFAPLENLGLVIVDEEHEASYKQFDSTPRYNARDVAIMRTHLSDAVVILGSATPSLESYNNARGEKYQLIELPERINTYPLPTVHVVDMREERRDVRVETPGVRTSVSRLLVEHMRQRIDRKEGIILLQNRRGFSPYLECLDCGSIEECTDCSVTMTFHKPNRHLRCHYCGQTRRAPDVCPKCRGRRLVYQGYGTQRIEEELQALLPDARIVRMDLDSTSRRGSHTRILGKFGRGEYDILLGTQMVAKGLDFNRVTLVGVISADTQLLLPDFRSSERTFQMLTQVAGRSGRSTIEGEVVIQTNHPDHYGIVRATKHDFSGFYEEEMARRTATQWPPVTRLALLETRSEHEASAEALLEQMHIRLREALPAEFILLGPSPAALARVKNHFRYHLVVKVPKHMDPSGKLLREAIKRSFPQKLPAGTRVIIDIDPYGVM
jgi:primosomal protein N' (replication factor Y) (superfamily II helicase)